MSAARPPPSLARGRRRSLDRWAACSARRQKLRFDFKKPATRGLSSTDGDAGICFSARARNPAALSWPIAFRHADNALTLRTGVTMITRRFAAVMVGFASLSSPALLQAQTLSALGSDVFKTIITAQTPAGRGVVAHTPIFLEDPTVTSVTTLIDGIQRQVGSQISLFPIGSSSGGFTYQYDAALGTFSRTTQSF